MTVEKGSRMALISRIICAALVVICLLPQRSASANEISQAYLLPELFEIMAAEGRAASTAEIESYLAGAAPQEWDDALGSIYDPIRLERSFSEVLAQELADMPDVVEDALRFARSDLGARVLRLEVSARAAMLEDEIDFMARKALYDARSANSDTQRARQLAQVRDRIAANDLVELNVMLGLNTSYAHYLGMWREGVLADLGAEDLLEMVWAQEDRLRADLDDWIESFFLFAYQPLSEAELQALTDYSGTPKADAFNRAMFIAYDMVFTKVSDQVGRLMGKVMQTHEL